MCKNKECKEDKCKRRAFLVEESSYAKSCARTNQDKYKGLKKAMVMPLG